jgi:hypothetical protein
VQNIEYVFLVDTFRACELTSYHVIVCRFLFKTFFRNCVCVGGGGARTRLAECTSCTRACRAAETCQICELWMYPAEAAGVARVGEIYRAWARATIAVLKGRDAIAISDSAVI